jgi:hypothetical protein
MHEHEFQGQKLRHEHRGDSQAHSYYDHAEDGSLRRSGIKRINTKAELQDLARELGVRPDWHEPDEQGVTAFVSGHSFDNAGFWGVGGTGTLPSVYQEMWVTVSRQSDYDGNFIPVAEVNLAMLFAWSCGYEEKPRRDERAMQTVVTETEEVTKITIRR